MHDIPDGYTRRATLGQTPDGVTLWCEYRPLLDSQTRRLIERVAWLARDGEPGLLQAEAHVHELLAHQIVFWNLRDSLGNSLPRNAISVASLAPEVAGALFGIITGLVDEVAEATNTERSARNLSLGIRFTIAHPELARRDCGDCLEHVYDESTGRPALHLGRPVRRPEGTAPPCRLPQVGCPKGTPEEPRTLTVQNQCAWLFDLECRAVGRYPDDAIVARNAAIIRAAVVA